MSQFYSSRQIHPITHKITTTSTTLSASLGAADMSDEFVPETADSEDSYTCPSPYNAMDADWCFP
jgi:hypothetical protein